MRLIDADLLIECMNNRYNEKKDIVPDNLAEGFMQMEKLIKEQPTAYDIDKILKQLENTRTISVNLGYGTIIETLRKDVVLNIINNKYNI